MRHGINQAHWVTSPCVRGDGTEVPSVHVPDSSDDVSLRRLLPAAKFAGGDDVVFTAIADSAETATAGELVVYRIGTCCPSQLIAAAMARGAAGILTEQLLPCPLPQCIVGDVELAMATIAAERLGHPDRKLLTVGVIGSAGKTSTALLVSSLLRGSGIRTGYQTDLGQSDGIVQLTPSESRPVGESLIHWLGEASETQCKAAVIELSDDDARHGHYDAIEFDLLVVTGSAICTADFGPSGLQCALERMTSDGVVVAPVDDAKAMRVIRDSGVKAVTYGVRKSADLTAKIIEQSGGMTTLLVNHQDTTAVMETSLCGAAMAANHAAAAMVGLLLAQPLHTVVEKLSELRSIPARGQRLTRYGRATVVLDIGGDPDRVAATLRTYRSMKSNGRLWCVLATGTGERSEVLARYGNLVERFADKPILTSQDGCKSSFLATSHAVLDGVERCAAMRLVADRRRAIEWAISEASPNDTILVISGERHTTPHQQRADAQRLADWVQQAWDKSEQQDQPVKLSIFG